MLEVNGISKTFGTLKAVDQLDFTVEPGQILGLIGQNGAGKTTTFRMILNFLDADNGQIMFNQKPLTVDTYNEIGYLPEERGLYPNMKVAEQIIYFAELRGQSKKVTKQKIDEWLTRFAVKGKKTDKIKALSKGNQQKIQLIATLIHEPKLIILDEPFSGLDPVNASLLEAGILWLKEKGSAIIFSSHDMSNVAAISDKIVMLKNGQSVLNGTIQEIQKQYGKIKVYVQTPLSIAELTSIQGVKSVEKLPTEQRYLVTLTDEKYGPDLFAAVTKDGYIPEFSQQAPTLDEIFRLKVGENNA